MIANQTISLILLVKTKRALLSKVTSSRIRNWLAAMVVILFFPSHDSFGASGSPANDIRAASVAKVPDQMADSSQYLAQVIRELEKIWPGNRTVNIVFHGHSVPSGYFKTPVVDSLNAYPNLLRSSLAKRFPHAVINVIVTAIGGENSQKGETRFASDVIICKPDVVFIDYALNDRRIGLSTAKSAWVSMIRKAQAAGVKVILLTPTPDTSAKLGDPNDPLNLHAAQIRQLAAEYHVGLVDSLSLFKDELTRGTPLTSLMAQVNHPNAAGHKLVAEEILKWFPATPTVSGDGRNSSIRP